MGKGGVGKTTLAVETAMVLKNFGSVVVVGIDQQHNHKDIIELGGYDVDYCMVQPEINEWVEFCLEGLGLKAYKSTANYLTPDLIAMIHLAETLRRIKDKYDYVVVDFPPNHSGLNIIRYPDIMQNSVYKVITIRQRIKRMVTGQSELLDRIEYLHDIVREMKYYLLDANWIVIGIPSPLGLIESVKAFELLTELKFKVYRVVCNMVYPVPESDCELCFDIYNKHNIYLERFNEYFNGKGFEVVQIPYFNDPEDMRSTIDDEILGEDFE